jgi:PAS domain-containing protein
MSDESTQHNLILILARDLTSRLANPAAVVDAEGTLVYFNEAAEPILGLTYAEAGELRAGEWAAQMDPKDPDGDAVPLEKLPLGVAFREGRPSHRALTITGGDGVRRDIESTAIPLCPREGLILGAVALFWERSRPADA